MRQSFAHHAVLIMAADADAQAPGAAITMELCGHWQHEGQCPVAPHHTRAERVNGDVLLRTLFATEPTLEDTVRQRIDEALARGQFLSADGATTRWRLRTSRRSDVSAEETDHAARLTRD
jgi:hypothetical protein